MPFSITLSYIVLRSLIHTHTVTACICVQTSWVSAGRDTALVKENMQVFLLNFNQLHSCHNPQIPWHIPAINPTCFFSLCKSLQAKYICLHLALPKVSYLEICYFILIQQKIYFNFPPKLSSLLHFYYFPPFRPASDCVISAEVISFWTQYQEHIRDYCLVRSEVSELHH